MKSNLSRNSNTLGDLCSVAVSLLTYDLIKQIAVHLGAATARRALVFVDRGVFGQDSMVRNGGV